MGQKLPLLQDIGVKPSFSSMFTPTLKSTCSFDACVDEQVK